MKLKNKYRFQYVSQLPRLERLKISSYLRKLKFSDADIGVAMCSKVCDLEDSISIRYV